MNTTAVAAMLHTIGKMSGYAVIRSLITVQMNHMLPMNTNVNPNAVTRRTTQLVTLSIPNTRCSKENMANYASSL